MRKIFTQLSLTITFLLLFSFCGGGESSENNDNTDSQEESGNKEDATETQENSVEEDKTIDEKYNHIARFLAGLSPEDNSPFTKYTELPAWKTYAANADKQWNTINQSKLPTIYKWRDAQLAEANKAGGTVFYPFSGADFLYVNSFFPEAEKTVMIALEPLGSMPNIDDIAQNSGSLQGYLNGLNRTQYAILNLSFFRTIAMAQDFTGRAVSKIDGNLPVLLVFMARTGHRILNYEKIALSPEGKVIPADQAKGDKTYYGTKIAYRREDKPNEYKTLYYFAANLQNTTYNARSGLSRKGLKDRKDLKNYLEGLDITSTYIKSASYLMYRDTFTIIRNLVLDKSKYYLQDDSGMPIKFIDENKWDLTFYGSYVRPISLFSVRYQPDLRAVYNGGRNIEPLPFGIGYQYRVGTSNLMFGVKK